MVYPRSALLKFALLEMTALSTALPSAHWLYGRPADSNQTWRHPWSYKKEAL